MLKKNDLIEFGSAYYRVLDITEEDVLLIDCNKRRMPSWVHISERMTCIDQAELSEITDYQYDEFESASVQRQNTAHRRYSMIAGILPIIGNKKQSSRMINDTASLNGISAQTLRKYLCDYLVFQDLSCLLPKDQSSGSKDLSVDEKNYRWALNRWFYNQNRHSLQWTYQQMLREKYCDDNGRLLAERPSFDQFRYFYRKNRSQQNYLISRNGIGDYQRNDRPLLGDSIQACFPNVGVGMLDGTICDIYLVNNSGNVIGRPVLTACVDAHTSLCCGYCLSLEGGTYNLRNLILNTVCDKVEWCREHNVVIKKEMWPCSELPGIMITDKGSEYISSNFSQLTDLGITLIDLDPFRPDLKPLVEKFFDVIQKYFKEELKSKGVVQKDFGERTNRIDYRQQACLTIEQFEMILIHSILYYNSQRIVSNYPYTADMLDSGVSPTAAGIWNYKIQESGTDLRDVDTRQLSLVLLPRTLGHFGRGGLKVNRLRYCHTEGNYIDRYLTGGDVLVAYSPDNVSRVWVIENGKYTEFHLIESRYKNMPVQEVEELRTRTNMLLRNSEEMMLQGRIDLSVKIQDIVNGSSCKTKTIKDMRYILTAFLYLNMFFALCEFLV